MLVTPPFGASSNIALWRAYSKPPVELVVADLNQQSHARKIRKANFPRNTPLPVYCSVETADRNTEELHGREMAKRRLCGGVAID